MVAGSTGYSSNACLILLLIHATFARSSNRAHSTSTDSSMISGVRNLSSRLRLRCTGDGTAAEPAVKCHLRNVELAYVWVRVLFGAPSFNSDTNITAKYRLEFVYMMHDAWCMMHDTWKEVSCENCRVNVAPWSLTVCNFVFGRGKAFSLASLFTLPVHWYANQFCMQFGSMLMRISAEY